MTPDNLQILQAIDRPLTARQIAEAAFGGADKVRRAGVYRSLDDLVTADLIVADNSGHPARWSRTGRGADVARGVG